MNPSIESITEPLSINMEKSYNYFEQELKLLQERIVSIESAKPDETGSFGYKCVNSLDRWRSERENMYRIITNPAATVVFYTRTIIESLTTGTLTEKEIRTSTLDICKDLGIKSTCRGTIAGLNLDVPAICNILASFGILELDTSSTSTINVRNSLSNYRKRLMDQCKDQFDAATTVDPMAVNVNVNVNSAVDIVEGELNTLASLADVIGKSYGGDDIFRIISLRWKEKLSKYLLDSQSIHFQALHNAAVAAAAAKSSAEAMLNSEFDATSTTAAQLGPVNDFDFDADNQLVDLEDGEGEEGVLNDLVPKPDTLWSTGGSDALPTETPPFSNSSSSSNFNGIVNGEATSVPGDVETTSGGVTSKVLKRASNQRAWRLAADIRHLEHPEKLLSDWSDACYADAAALETEEAVLRRLVGQCELGIDNKPRRVGTAYLTQPSTESQSFSQTGIMSSGTRTLRQGAELTGEQLWEKARANFVRRKLLSKGGARPSVGMANDAISAYGAAFPIPHPATIGEDGAGFLTHAGANKYAKKVNIGAGSGETRAQHGLAAFQAARMRSFVPPVVLQNENVYWESVTQKGSIFASQFPAPPSSFPATLIRPDLTLFTTEVPWTALAREFVTMDYEDFQQDSAVSSAHPSQPNSARGSTNTPKYTGSHAPESSSSHAGERSKRAGLSSGNSPNRQAGDKSARKPLSVSTSLASMGSQYVAAPGSNSKPSEVLAPTFMEIEPINRNNYKTWRLAPVSKATDGAKDDLNCSREIFHDDSSTEDVDEEEDISDEAVDARHAETLRKMRDRWMQLQQLRQERKLLLSGGPNALKSASGSGHKHGPGYKKKYGGTPRSDSGASTKGPAQVSAQSHRKRGRGRPPKAHHHSQYAHANGHSNGALSAQSHTSGSAMDDDGDSRAPEQENGVERYGQEEETDSAIDKDDEEEETEELPEIKRLHTRSGALKSPAHSVNGHSRRVA